MWRTKMKRIISLILITIIIFSGVSASADTNENKEKFQVKEDGDNFVIILDENITTGYQWIYSIADEAHVTYVKDNQITNETDLVGVGGKREFYFKVNADGLSTITFEYKRSWEEEVAESLKVSVNKSGDKVSVKEDGINSDMDTSILVSYEANEVYYNDELIDSDVKTQIIDGVTMIPLRSTAEKMGYTVTWNNKTKSVEILQGAQWTSIKISENTYIKNKMAPLTLSAAPVIVDSRTLVPAEFFNVILSKGIIIEEGNLKLNDNDMFIHSGYVKEINYDETGNMSITLATDMESDDIMLETIIHTSKSSTYINKEVVEGEYINVISSMIMTMSIPGQTSGYIIY
jgi:predicted secreted protein